MKKYPKVIIVGRPNVGKSTIFNRIIGRKKSIIDSYEGVTRDFLSEKVEIEDKIFELIDTGGIIEQPQDIITQKVIKQVIEILKQADLILFTVDGRAGVTAQDKDLFKLLKNYKEKIILVVNKIDNFKDEDILLSEFYMFSIPEMIGISAENIRNLGLLIDKILTKIEYKKYEEDEKKIKITIAGYVNAGKSTLLNAILNENRVIVSDIPGTTRDAIDCEFKFKENDFLILDTPGLRRKNKVDTKLEVYSGSRAIRSIEICDIAVLVIDCSRGILQQEKKIAGLIERRKKNCIIFINKWDLAKNKDRNLWLKSVKKHLHYISFAPVIFGEAINKKGVDTLLEKSISIYEKTMQKFKTSKLNNILLKYKASVTSSLNPQRRLKIKFISQVKSNPITFKISVNSGKYVTQPLKRHIKKFFSRELDIEEIRLDFVFADSK